MEFESYLYRTVSALRNDKDWNSLHNSSPSRALVYRSLEQIAEEPYSPIGRITVIDGPGSKKGLRSVMHLVRPFHILVIPEGTPDPTHHSRRLVDYGSEVHPPRSDSSGNNAMTILNHTNDGLYPELIAMYRASIHLGDDTPENLIGVCNPSFDSSSNPQNRLRGVLSKWKEMGLFEDNGEKVRVIKKNIQDHGGRALDEASDRLPKYCCDLLFEEKNALPLWGEGSGIASDFFTRCFPGYWRKIYTVLPTVWNKGIDPLLSRQMSSGKNTDPK